MNKIFNKVAVAFVGIAMAIGVGVAVGSTEKSFAPAEAALPTGAITDYTNMSAGDYYIGATTSGTNYYLSVVHDSTSESIAGTAVTSKASASIFTFTGSGSSWTIKFQDNDYYLGLKTSKDNGKVKVLSESQTFTAANKGDYIKLYVGEKSVLEKNSGGTQFGNYQDTQAGVWLEPASSKFSVTYNGNGSTGGSVPTDATEYSSGNTVTVKGNPGSLVKANASPAFSYSFGGWNTKADGTGTNYAENATFTISTNTTLYAKWNDPRTLVTLSASDMEIAVGDADEAPTITSSPEGHTSGYTLTSDTPSVASIIDNKVHAVSKGSSEITVHIDGDSSYRYADATFTVTVTKVMADNGTGLINFGSAAGSTNVNATSVNGEDSQSNTWSITTVMDSESFTSSASYSQIGSSSKPATSITFTTTLSKTVKITDFSAKFGGFTDTDGTVTLKVGSTTVATDSLNGTSDVVVGGDITDTSGNALTVTVTDIAKGVKVYYISYTYITEINVTSVSVSPTEVTLAPNATQQLTPTVLPDNATNKSVTYSSDHTNIATVSNTGLIRGVADGTATITVTTVDGSKTATCDVTVETPVGAYASIDSTLLGIVDGDYAELDITYGGTFTTGLSVHASNDNVEVALDDNGDGTGTVTVSFEAAGLSTIFFKDGSTTIEGVGTTCSVTILEKLNAINANTESVSNLTFTDEYSESGATADDSKTWTVTSNASETTYEEAKGIHYGTTDKAVKHITLTSSSFTTGRINKVVVNATANGNDATVSVTVGGVAFGGAAQNVTASPTDFTFKGNAAAGTIVVTITKASSVSKALYCKSIKVTTLNSASSDVANSNATVQQEVLDFVETMNSDLSVCDGSKVLSTSVWSGLASKFETAAAASSDETLFRKMFRFADATPRAQDGSASTGDTLQNALARYNYVLEKYGISDYADFLDRVGANKVTPLSAIQPEIVTFNNLSVDNGIVLILTIASISVLALGGYFLLRRKEN